MRRPGLLVLLSLLLLPTSAARTGDGEVQLLTDETIPLYLARGRELARNQQWDTMVDVLQRIVIGDPKVFTDLDKNVLNAAVYSEDGVIFYPARELCLKELAAMPPEGLRAYRTRHDPAARDLMSAADAIRNVELRISAYAKVFDAYLVSSVGDDALEKAADLNLELGRFYEALALFRRLVEVYPKDTDRDLAMVLAKAAYCAARIGDREHRDVLLERLASEYERARIRVEGKLVSATELKDHPALKLRGASDRITDGDWPVPGGNPARSRIVEDLPDDLAKKPFWRHRLAQRDARLEALFGQWQVSVHDRSEAPKPQGQVHSDLAAPYPTVRPILYDGLVFYKDCLEFVARRVGSGAFVPLRGRYVLTTEGATEGSDKPGYHYPVRHVRPDSGGNPALAKVSEDIHRFLDYGGNTVVAAADQIYVVENRHAPSYMRSALAPKPKRPNLLVTYDRFNGKTLWGWEGDLCARGVRSDPQSFKEWNRDFQAHNRPNFRGPGVASGGMLYTVAYEGDGALSGVSLWALDLKQGTVRFRTLIHRPDEVAQRLPVGSALAVAGGVVYVQTGGGVVAAVDSLPPGRVRWITRYRRTYERKQNRRRRRGRGWQRSLSTITQNFAHNEPIVVAGKVIVAPPDSPDVTAFHAETGRVAWRITKNPKNARGLGKVAHIVGVSDGILVLAGSDVCGIDIDKGELLWGPNTLRSGFAYGRGLVGAKYAYVPTTRPNEKRASIRRFELRTGEEAASLTFNVEKLGNLLAVNGRLIVANDVEVMCFSTAQHELDDIDARIARDGRSGALMVERARILGRAQKPTADVTAAYMAALDAVRDGARPTDVSRVRMRVVDHLFELALQKADIGALEKARTVLDQAAKDGAQRPLARLRAYEAQAGYLTAVVLARTGKAKEALESIERFLDENAGSFVVIGSDQVKSGAAAARDLRNLLVRDNKEFEQAFIERVRARIKAAFEKGDVDALRAIPRRYDNVPPTEEAFFALARLHEDRKETVEAEGILRNLIDRFGTRPSVAEAHLRLARILIGKGLLVEARIERNKAISRMDEATRTRLAGLLSDVDKKLPAPGQPVVVPRLRMPLKQAKFDTGGVVGATAQIAGDRRRIRDDFVLVADEAAYYAFGTDGALKWRQPNPTGAGVRYGRPEDKTTAVVASAVAARRTVFAVGTRIVIGDVFGITCLDAESGKIFWQRPRARAQAARIAQRSIESLRTDIARLQKADDLPRHNRLPTFAQAGSAVVSAHPLRGVETFDIESSELIWQDTEVLSPTIGQPQVLGQLLAVGWAHPGRIRVYGIANNRVYQEYMVPNKGQLLAGPVLDPLGRLLVVEGGDKAAKAGGRLRIVNARSGKNAHGRTYPVMGRYATLLYADGRQAVFHDGGSGRLNLHFIDLAKQAIHARAASDMLREVEVVQDGARLFVFTHTLGVSDLGARLMRVDVEGRDVLDYELPPRAPTYARPLLTREHVVIAAWGGTGARLRLYDREASSDSRKPRAVFTRGGALSTEYEAQFAGKANYAVPPAIAVAGTSLFFSHPYGWARFVGPDPR